MSGDVSEKKNLKKRRGGGELKKKRVEKLFGECLFVWVEYLFGWDAIGYIGWIFSMIGWIGFACFYIFESRFLGIASNLNTIC